VASSSLLIVLLTAPIFIPNKQDLHFIYPFNALLFNRVFLVILLLITEIHANYGVFLIRLFN
jgi:hypothetical protein